MKSVSLGRTIRHHRERAGLSRRELSMLADVSETAIYDVEHDKETVQLLTVRKLMDVLNMTLRIEGPMMDELRTDRV